MKRRTDDEPDPVAERVRQWSVGRRQGLCEGVAMAIEGHVLGRGVVDAFDELRRIGLGDELDRQLQIRGLSFDADAEPCVRCGAPSQGLITTEEGQQWRVCQRCGRELEQGLPRGAGLRVVREGDDA